MGEDVGFISMAGAKAEGDAPEIGIGMLGYAFMGKAHSNAFKKIPYMMYPPVAIPRLVAVCGRNEEAVANAARRFGYEGYYTDWHKMIGERRDPGLRQRRSEQCPRRADHRRRAGGQERLLRETARPHSGRSEIDAGRRGKSGCQASWSPSITASSRPLCRLAS